MQVPTVQPAFKGQNARLMEAARYGKLYRVARLLRAEGNIDAQDARGITALIFAAMAGQVQVVNALIAAGADKRIVDRLGYDA